MDIPTQSKEKPQKRHSSSFLRLSLNSASSTASASTRSTSASANTTTSDNNVATYAPTTDIPVFESVKPELKGRKKGSIRSSLKFKKKKSENREKQNSRLGVTRQEMSRYDSLNSVFSGSGSAGSHTGSSSANRTTGSESRGSESRSSSFDEVTQVQDFEEIEMPQEGELSNLDVNWFLNYKCSTLTTTNKI